MSVIENETNQSGLVVKEEQPVAQLPAQNQATTILEVISQVARDPNSDIEKMERLMNMHERMLERDAESAYWAAMVGLQGDLPTIPKNGVMKQTNKDKSASWEIPFAKFEDVIEHIKPVLREHGFSLTFKHEDVAGGIKTTAVLAHKLGHKEEDTFTSQADVSGSKNSIQAIGSARSYGRRYTSLSLLGLAFGGDDNNGASVVDDEQSQPARKNRVDSAPATDNGRKATEKQVAFIGKKLAISSKDIEDVKEKFAVNGLEDIAMSQVNDVLAFLS